MSIKKFDQTILTTEENKVSSHILYSIPLTSTEATNLSDVQDGDIIYVNSVGGDFTSIGFWTRVDGVWLQRISG